jgi:hypothetical protein
VAVHATCVDPSGNVAPVAGEHDTLVGGAPPVTVGDPYDTVIGWPVGDCIDTGAGHSMVGAPGTGVGGTGEPPQA